MYWLRYILSILLHVYVSLHLLHNPSHSKSSFTQSKHPLFGLLCFPPIVLRIFLHHFTTHLHTILISLRWSLQSIEHNIFQSHNLLSFNDTYIIHVSIRIFVLFGKFSFSLSSILLRTNSTYILYCPCILLYFSFRGILLHHKWILTSPSISSMLSLLSA